MDVILDTNSLHNDHFLKGADIDKLSITAKKGGHIICIPEVVVQEMKKHFIKTLEQSYKQVGKGFRDFERITGENMKNPFAMRILKKFTKEYEKLFRNRCKELNISILTIPKNEEDTILKKAVKRLKPFKDSGAGYPDALIWSTILQRAEKFSEDEVVGSPRIIFVTNNHTDFCESDAYALHPDLISELNDLEINPAIIKVSPNLDSAFKLIFESSDEIIRKDIMKFIESASFYKSDLNDQVIKRIMKYLPYKSFESDEVGFPDSFESPTIDMFNEDFEFEIESIDVLSENEIAIKWNVSLTCLFDIYVPKADLAYFEDDNMPSVYDYNWNSHYVAAQTEKKVWFTVEVIVDHILHHIQSFEMDINEEINNNPRKTFRSTDL